jgi:two-component system, chemotaxis family, CheB/CheR fusion protein
MFDPPTDPDVLPATPLPWVVVVGASAGGLEALQRFFGSVQSPAPAAFVVIQHLAPDYRSMMSELLGRHSALPVHEATAGEVLLPEHIYLMPPGVLMTVEDEHLQFSPRPERGVSLPIDRFLQSLASTIPARSVAVVLSGSGSDGAVGCAALRAAGGYVMAQAPETASFDSMPRSVVAATAVDAVQPPELLARQVLALTRGEAGRLASGELLNGPAVKPALQLLFEALRQRSGVDFTQYKLPTMMRRIERRMAVLGCASVSDYAERMVVSDEECELLRRELLIPVTSFFRDPAAFEAVGRALQAALQAQPLHQPLRIWCAGCATGEEAYSLAIVALEACNAVQRWPGIKVFATDLDERFLAVAGSGSYPADAADQVSPERQAAFFSMQDDRIQVRPEVRQMVLFARHNLLEDAPFTKLDLAVCRNTLIYLQIEAQERVLRRLQYALNPQALLFLGSSESLGALQADFQVVDAASKIYRIARPVMHALSMQRLSGAPAREPLGLPLRARRPTLLAPTGPSLVDQGLLALTQSYVPASLLVNAQRQLLHAWGPTERYLRLPAGQAQLDAVRLLPPRLGAVVAHAITQVVRSRQPYAAAPVLVEQGESRQVLRVVARPLSTDDAAAEPCVVLSLEPVAEPLVPQPATDGTPRSTSEGDRIDTLERELADTRATLQTSIEELESANEEMQVANEELMSSNEELQSTNEELQSVNEELYTVNAEYNAKLDLVNALNADLDGMSRATGIATLFVDHALRLVRFTPEATLLFRLRSDDAGRSITDFSCQLDYPDLVADLRRALAQAEPVERELAGPAGTRYLARAIGYGDTVAGQRRAVLSLVDVTRLHDAQRLQQLIDSLPEHVALIDAMGTIRQVNRAWSEFAHQNGGSDALEGMGLGTNYLAAVARSTSADASDVLRGMQQVLAGALPDLRRVYPCHSPAQKRWFLMTVSPLHGGRTSGRLPSGAVVTHLDITPWAGPQGLPYAEGLQS